LLLVALWMAAACAPLPATPMAPAAEPVAVPGFVFERDTFAFANQIRSRNPHAPDLYANYCFVLARGLRQFFQFARFDPAQPRLDEAGYVARVRQVVARPPWAPSLPPAARVVIPGYSDLRSFTAAEEHAVKAGLPGRFWTWVHWTNWRVVMPVTAAHQAEVARQIVEELRRGRLVQLLVTNLPRWELNHTLVAYAARPAGADVEFVVWDPNDPTTPGRVTFHADRGRFWATAVHDTAPGPIRVFRMNYSWFL
jgi:hypothetical protein